MKCNWQFQFFFLIFSFHPNVFNSISTKFILFCQYIELAWCHNLSNFFLLFIERRNVYFASVLLFGYFFCGNCRHFFWFPKAMKFNKFTWQISRKACTIPGQKMIKIIISRWAKNVISIYLLVYNKVSNVNSCILSRTDLLRQHSVISNKQTNISFTKFD